MVAIRRADDRFIEHFLSSDTVDGVEGWSWSQGQEPQSSGIQRPGGLIQQVRSIVGSCSTIERDSTIDGDAYQVQDSRLL